MKSSRPSPLSRPVFFLLLFLLLGGLWFFNRPDVRTGQPQIRSRLIMGTVVEITVFAPSPKAGDRAMTAAFAEMTRIERLMSPHLPDSDLARLSASGTEPVAVSPETARVISRGLNVARASDGAFDLTLGRLKELWGIETDHPRVPAPEEIRQALRGTGPDGLHVNGNLVAKRDPRLSVDLGGIAKGYALEQAANVLKKAGIEHAAINAGGDIRLLGDKKGAPWKIGIQDPRNHDRIIARLELEDTAVVTSGDYERFFIHDGRRYHHLFDPATG